MSASDHPVISQEEFDRALAAGAEHRLVHVGIKAAECSCGKWACSTTAASNHETLRAAFAEHALPFLKANMSRLEAEIDAAQNRLDALRLQAVELECPFVAGDVIEWSDGAQGVIIGFTLERRHGAYARWRRILKGGERLHSTAQNIYAYSRVRKVGVWGKPLD